ncbi:MAG: hypothetical protein Q8R36_02990 [bacterium]|nr:hypothetical protein [bacterium]
MSAGEGLKAENNLSTKTITNKGDERQLKTMLEKSPEEFKKIGLLFYILIRIENNLNSVISIFFCEFNQTKNLIFNQALLNEKVFPTLENKRRFLLIMIQYLAEEAKERNLQFEEKRWREICSSIQKLQETRNNLAHKFIAFSGNNIASYILRKKHNQVEEEKKQGEKYEPFETKKINLDNEVEKAEKIFQDSEKLLTEFLGQALRIVNSK